MLRGHARCGVAGWVSRMYRNTWGTCGAGQGRYTCTCAVGGVVYERTAPHSGSSAPGARFALECGGATVLSCPDVRRELQLALECLRASSQDSSRRTATHSGRVHPHAPLGRTFSFNSSHCSRGVVLLRAAMILAAIALTPVAFQPRLASRSSRPLAPCISCCDSPPTTPPRERSTEVDARGFVVPQAREAARGSWPLGPTAERVASCRWAT